ncbi:MAG: hypothetical protein AAGM38_08150 [Pseudomonadota bacterium]
MAEAEGAPDDIAFGTEAEWAAVHDCYGPSTSTPRTLKRLFSPDEKTRKNAISWLYAALFHQGGRFEATIKAAPLVIEIALHPALPPDARRFLCEYIVSLAYGFAEELPYRGVFPPDHLALLDEAKTGKWREMSEAARQIERYCDRWVARDLYRAIIARRAALYPLIEHENASVAAAARIALSLLAADDPAFRARFEALLGRETADLASTGAPAEIEPAVSLIIGAATMARAARIAAPEALLGPWLEAAAPRLRFAAAIALAEPDRIDRFRAPLIDGLTTPTVRGARTPVHQVWTSLEALALGLVEDALADAPEARTALWLDAFAANLDAPDTDRALKSTSMILNLLSPSRTKRFADTPASALTPLQRRGLEAIRDRGFWSVAGGAFLNFTQLIGAYGLPETKEGLSDYLDP